MNARDVAARVLGVGRCPLPYFRLRLRLVERFGEVAPGQFVMVLTDPGRDPLLRRAFSVFDISRDEAGVSIELLGKVVGRGTERLASRPEGSEVRVLGPLGHGFRVERVQRAALVAGGVGSAALLLLARRLVAEQRAFDVYYGGRTAADLACSDRFEDLARASGGRLVAVTEDGSRGRRGLVTEPLEQALAEGEYGVIYTCGPTPMMKAVAELAVASSVPGQAALETEMGCGFGACLGCVVARRAAPYALCCQDGPVFELDRVLW